MVTTSMATAQDRSGRPRPGLVARRGDLPDLSAQLPGLRTATASATSPASSRGCPTSPRLGVDAIWISPFFTSPMLDFGYDVSDYRDVDPMFGTLGDFDALIAPRPRPRAAGDDRPRAQPHAPTSTAGSRRAGRAATTPRPTGTSGPTPSPTAPRRTTGCRSSAAPPGSGTASGSSTTCTTSSTEQPDLNFHNPEVQAGAARRRALLARHAASTASASTRSTSTSTTSSCATTRRCRAAARDYSTAPAVNPYNWQDHLYDKSRPENLGFLERMRALMDEYPATAAVGEVGDAQRSMEVVGQYTSGERQVHMCYAFEFLSGFEAPSGTRIAEVLEPLRRGRARRLGLLGVLQPRRRAPRHALEARRRADPPSTSRSCCSLRGSVCLYQGEELGPARGLRAVRGPARSLRHPLLAEVQRPRRLPHADALGERQHLRRLLRREALAAGLGRPHCRARSALQDADPGSILAFYRAHARLAARRSGARQGRLPRD